MRFRRPRVKAVHHPERFERTRQIRIGTTQVGVGATIPDEDGSIWELLHLLDGTRSVAQVVEALASRRPALDPASVEAGIDQLAEQGYLEEADWVPPEALSAQELQRYSRAEQFFSWVHTRPERSPFEVQARLKRAKVTLLGLGGAGSNVALSLVAAGVGSLHCVDFDTVEPSNLTRQFLYCEDDVGASKVERAVARLRRLNSTVQVSGEELRVAGVEDLEPLMQGRDLFILCADQPTHLIQLWTSDAALRTGCPWLFCLYAGPMVVVSTFVPGRTACYRCFHRTAEERAARVHGPKQTLFPGELVANAVIAPTAALTGQTGALEAIYLLGGLRPRTVGRVWHQNVLEYDHSYDFVPERYPDCPACGDGARREGAKVADVSPPPP